MTQRIDRARVVAYRCDSCGNVFEIHHLPGDLPATCCRVCGGRLRRTV